MEKKLPDVRKCITAFFLSAVLILSGCSGMEKKAKPESPQKTVSEEETRIFTDSLGRSVKLPFYIDKAAVTGPLPQAVMFGFAPERLAAFSDDTFKKAEYVCHDYDGLPVIGSIYKNNFSIEELLLCGASVVIDIGEEKENIEERMDELSKRTGIPFIHISMSLSDPDECFEKLGELFNLSERAKGYGEICREIYEETSGIAASLPEKIRALYIVGNAKPYVCAKESYHSEVIDLLTENTADISLPSSDGTGSEADMEQILLWDPEVIFADYDSFMEAPENQKLWNSLSAVKNGKVFKVPSEPFCWFGKPPSVQRYLGMLYLTSLLYPEKAVYDIYEKTSLLFSMFFGYDLKRSEFDDITNNIFKVFS